MGSMAVVHANDVSAPRLIGRWSRDDGSETVAANTDRHAINGMLTNGPPSVAGYPLNAGALLVITIP